MNSIKKLPVSVCMLCLNESERLPNALKYLNHFAEWLVYDTGSTDDSANIARKMGATVASVTWEGFSRTRVRHFREARENWILWLDADEFLTEKGIEELQHVFENGEAELYDAFRLNRMIYFQGKWIRHGDWFPDWNVRLFRSNCWDMEDRSVHESLQINGKIGRLEEHLEHHSFTSWEDKERRSHKYAKLWAEMESEKGKRAAWWTPYLRGAWKFLKGFFVKKGFLDGIMGLRIAISNARETHLKYRLLKRQSSNS